jgi:hypothetical protein
MSGPPGRLDGFSAGVAGWGLEGVSFSDFLSSSNLDPLSRGFSMY